MNGVEEIYFIDLKGNPMTQNRRSGFLTGIFLIIATAMGIVAVGMIGPILGSENYLVSMAENSSSVRIALFADYVMAGCVIAVAVVIFPVLKAENETLAMGYLAARTVEGAALALAGVAWLLMASLGREFIAAGLPEGTHFQTLGMVLSDVSTIVFNLGAEIAFSISALILNYVFWRTNLVPRFLSVWGFVAGLLMLALGGMKVLGLPVSSIEIAFTVPIALNEMVLAVWLIAKGFNTSNA